MDTPLLPTLHPCPHCGTLVCVRLWVMAEGKRPGRWKELEEQLTPVFGDVHQCPAGSESRGDDAVREGHAKLSMSEPCRVSVQSGRAKGLVPSAPAGSDKGHAVAPVGQLPEDHRSHSK